ncbi:hypothetical protein C8A03DRAFT_17412 [Achaetomium macrosporum]|uniref:Heterokaryon incompatibility domain-containing protein n=1 Tax=Achaetomium macrosporum TaxID=79813 RepID=A0AAN7C5P6_9PEZI|nr:hypothetical protein C8A03DRAFT_17412 [Achaetomium macrosporum]
MALDTAKVQGNALSKLLDKVDLTPQMLAKTFKEVGESPEKLRALLNLWFVPWFKPTFVPDRDYAVAGLRDVEFLSTPDLPPSQLPFRMFDVDTGNLVEFPAIGVRGQYCMLSHRWKGTELTLDYVKEARRKALERAKENSGDSNSDNGGSKQSDVELVLDQCKLDLEEQESLIKRMYGKGRSGEPASIDDANVGDCNIGELLSRRLKARAALDRLGWAKEGEDQARTKLRFAEMERKIFRDLAAQMHDRVDEKMEEYLGRVDKKEKRPASHLAGNEVGSEVVRDIQVELDKAEAKRENAQAAYDAVKADIQDFQGRRDLRDAIDEMVCRLQRWKSAIKVKEAIRKADHIFKNKLFQQREKCYLWTDTCCIDKKDAGELSQSLSLMGDWYAAAEYTLVQLDTPFDEEDAVKDWHLFKDKKSAGEDSTGLGGSEPNIEGFEKVLTSELEWSTRAWTLQELVMSKTTFYANSQWTLLSRPVESLGYLYYTVPFIALYTRGDTRNIYRLSGTATQGIWDADTLKQEILRDEAAGSDLRKHIERKHTGSSGNSKDTEAIASREAARVETAQQLIALLGALGVRIPGNLTMETATSETARAVYLASADLSRGKRRNTKEDAEKRELLNRLNQYLPPPDLTALPAGLDERETEEEVIQHTINFLLQCLVAETDSLILADRKYVAEFGQVHQLRGWQQGMRRSGFSAQSVLEASSKRNATVATDRSYALMGVLGVRFPTFPAEGYVKALARLLDDVVITHNDISVFNWTGVEMGSPVRGRSMYPASHTAYGNLEDRSRRYNLLLSERVQIKMNDIVATYHVVIHTLRNAIELAKDKEHKNLPLNWLERIVQLVQSTGFQELKHQQEIFAKIIGYLREHCGREKELREKLRKEKEAKAAEAATSRAPAENRPSLFKRPTIPSVPSVPSLPTSSFSLRGNKPSSSAKKEEESSEGSAKKGSKFSLGKTMKASSFSLSKKGNDDSSTAKEPPTEAVSDPGPTEVAADPPPPYEEVPTSPTAPSWQAVDKVVTEYLFSPTAQRVKSSLPPELQDIKTEAVDIGGSNVYTFRKHVSQEQGLDTISPNPIIVNNSGIEGLFDIQRVIVTMIDPEKLRRQIAKAASPHDKISGWCSISTGFARVITSFACERRILEQELEAIEAIEARVLREQDKDEDEKRSARLLKKLSITRLPKGQEGSGGAAGGEDASTNDRDEDNDEENDKSNDKGDDKHNDTQQSADEEANEDPESGNTEEERLVSRMVDFIQEAQLEFVAGEWVLARFSGAAGASWFLCHLELGPVPGQFYGHRIATGAIDFHNSTPEPGLVNVWQTYMERKKRKMCYILNDYIHSRMTAMDSKDKLKAGTDSARQGLNTFAKGIGGFGLNSPGGGKSSAEPSAGPEEGEGRNKENNQAPERNDDSDGEDLLDKVLAHGKLAVKLLGEHTVLAVVEKLLEMRADHLDKTLATAVLKRTPKSLRTAVENMNENRSFLPAMFHSSTRVHMF